MRTGQVQANLPELIDAVPEAPTYLSLLIAAKASGEHRRLEPVDGGSRPLSVKDDVERLQGLLEAAQAGPVCLTSRPLNRRYTVCSSGCDSVDAGPDSFRHLQLSAFCLASGAARLEVHVPAKEMVELGDCELRQAMRRGVDQPLVDQVRAGRAELF